MRCSRRVPARPHRVGRRGGCRRRRRGPRRVAAARLRERPDPGEGRRQGVHPRRVARSREDVGGPGAPARGDPRAPPDDSPAARAVLGGSSSIRRPRRTCAWRPRRLWRSRRTVTRRRTSSSRCSRRRTFRRTSGEVADGVTKLRDRGAWMPRSRARWGRSPTRGPEALFDAVQRSAGDPAAKLELLAVAANDAASLDERRMAVNALLRQGADKKVLETLQLLLAHADAGPVESALLARARRQAVDDADRRRADRRERGGAGRGAAARVPQLGKNPPKETKEQRGALIEVAVWLATTDSDPEVRRSALAWIGQMPKATQAQVLEAARNDVNPGAARGVCAITGGGRARDAGTDRHAARLAGRAGPRRRVPARRPDVGRGRAVPAGWNPRARAAAWWRSGRRWRRGGSGRTVPGTSRPAQVR